MKVENNTINAYFLFILIVFALSGCVTTKTSSFVDPEYAHERHSRPIVWGKIAPLNDRQLLEGSIVSAFKDRKINAIKGTDVFPPTRDVTNEFITNALLESEGDSLLVVSLKEGSGIYYMKYEAVLYNLDFNRVWISSIETSLDQAGFTAAQGRDASFHSTAHELVNKIIGDRVIEYEDTDLFNTKILDETNKLASVATYAAGCIQTVPGEYENIEISQDDLNNHLKKFLKENPDQSKLFMRQARLYAVEFKKMDTETQNSICIMINEKLQNITH